jgi:hypothetical protein
VKLVLERGKNEEKHREYAEQEQGDVDPAVSSRSHVGALTGDKVCATEGPENRSSEGRDLGRITGSKVGINSEKCNFSKDALHHEPALPLLSDAGMMARVNQSRPYQGYFHSLVKRFL